MIALTKYDMIDQVNDILDDLGHDFEIYEDDVQIVKNVDNNYVLVGYDAETGTQYEFIFDTWHLLDHQIREK